MYKENMQKYDLTNMAEMKENSASIFSLLILLGQQITE